MKLQALAHPNSSHLTQVLMTVILSRFGDASTHAGSFVFEAGVEGILAHTWSGLSTSTNQF